MPRLALALVAAAGLSACGDPRPPPEPAPQVSERAVRDRVAVGRESSPAPSESKREPPSAAESALSDAAWTSGHPGDVALARRLADPVSGEAARAEWEALPEERRVDVLRTGLRLDGAAAVLAAQELEWWQLDAWESARVVEVLVPVVMDEEADISTEALRSVIGSGDLPALFAEMRTAPRFAGETNLLSALHRQLRGEHLPVLVEMALGDDELLSDQAFDEIAIVLSYTDGPRQDVARIFAGKAERPEPVGALPAELVVAIRALQAGRGTGDHRDGYFLAWALRWLRETTPVDVDVPVLLEISERAEFMRDNVRVQVALALGRSTSGLADAPLREWAREEDPLGTIALTALARRGDLASADTLLERAEADSLALACALHAAPERATAMLDRRLTDADDEPFDWIDDAFTERWLWGLDWDDALLRDTVARSASRTPTQLLLELAAMHPPWRTRAVAELVSRRLAVPQKLRNIDPDVLHAGLPFLEVGARETLVATLGERADAGAAEPDEDGVIARAALERLAGDDPSGLPRRVAQQLREWVDDALAADELTDDDPVLVHWSAGRGVAALLAYIDGSRGYEIEGVGRVDDARFRAALVRQATVRSTGRAQWALGELAIAGDPEARAALREIVRSGRYRWVDNASGLALTDGGDPATLPFWIGESESNCCRVVPAMMVFEEAFGADVGNLFPLQSGNVTTLATWLRWWWHETGGVAWSDAADGYVPAVR